ncbi:MAG TPA: homoserine dehydrogenase [Candidatus Thermoplasmatota archaeon]|nr:homoserine dehydrogenase [Candidatus Thermoplasmatota archaeon]
MTARILLAGHGSVGKAFHELAIESGVGKVVGVVRRAGAWLDEAGVAPGGTLLAKRQHVSVVEALDKLRPDVFVELTPSNLQTGEPGAAHIRAALERGIPVVTANKGPLLRHFDALTSLAREKRTPFRFEGTVGGSIPVMNLHEFALVGNPVTRVDGILNGTSNYILTRMAEEGLGFDEALKEAQELGYAEADPTADVGGHDAAAKLCILANAVLGVPVKFEDVGREGIQSITAAAIRLAEKEGYAIRLIASVDAATKKASVAPRLVPHASTLNVRGTLNVVRFTTKYAGAFTISGKGAGGKETATAVLSDVLHVLAKR